MNSSTASDRSSDPRQLSSTSAGQARTGCHLEARDAGRAEACTLEVVQDISKGVTSQVVQSVLYCGLRLTVACKLVLSLSSAAGSVSFLESGSRRYVAAKALPVIDAECSKDTACAQERGQSERQHQTTKMCKHETTQPYSPSMRWTAKHCRTTSVAVSASDQTPLAGWPLPPTHTPPHMRLLDPPESAKRETRDAAGAKTY